MSRQEVCRDQKVCRDQESMSRQEVCCDKESMSRPGEYVATKQYVATSVATRKLCRDQKR